MIPIAILCGGKGTRLGDLTWTCPKSLVQINDRPFLFWQLELLKENGFEDVVLCTGHLAYMIYDAVGDGHQYGLKVHYSYDGPTPLGTAGAIRRALPILGDTFCTLYGDSYLDIDYQAIIHYFEITCPLAVMTAPDTERVDYGFGVFQREAFETTNSVELNGVYDELERRGELRTHTVRYAWNEIGSREGIARLNEKLRLEKGAPESSTDVF